MVKKYVLVGASVRGLRMFGLPIVEGFADHAAVVGVFDHNKTRATYVAGRLGSDLPVYTDFDEMMREAKPDIAIVTTVDCTHHEYIIRSLESGVDVVTEKPLTTDEVKLAAILEAERRTGRKVTVTFNYRYAPYATRIKELIQEGAIGDVLSVHFEYLLDTSHGADYFRRWHRRRENSGSLLVHKSTHHFDLVNWWLAETPEEVFANGTRRFYGPTRQQTGARCSTCPHAESCEFFVDFIGDPLKNELYFKAEHEDGYFRDGCVFSDEVNIEDSMSVTVRYSKGTLLTYSLTTYSPYEGWRVNFNGTKGRLEAAEFHSGELAGFPTQSLDIYLSNGSKLGGEKITHTIRKGQGGHSGGDIRLHNMLFREGIPDPLGHTAGSADGANSILVGICASKSIKEKKPFLVRDFL